MAKTPITVAHGDGIGPEIMTNCLRILESAGAQLEIETVEIGEKLYLSGHPTGIEAKTWDSLRRTKVFYKAPITTPQGGGFKSLNVTVRTTLGLYANIRPCVSFSPYIHTKHPNMDVVIVRENEEDLYSGIEYMQTPNVAESIKLISRSGSEKIIRYAFEYAKAYKRKKVTCFAKDNIMKFSDGLFHSVFDEIAKEYPELESEFWIVDIGAAKLADTPENFDVVVMPNLYGDIISDIAAQISGSVGLVGTANIGIHGTMFEAIHGSAPRRAGQNVANPTGLLFAGILMLNHIGQGDIAEKVHNAWLCTIEEGVHTYDIYKEGKSSEKVSTSGFADAIINNLGKTPTSLSPAKYEKTSIQVTTSTKKASFETRELVGCDVYIYSENSVLADLEGKTFGNFELKYLGNRGAKIYPDGLKETACIEQWRCRFMPKSGPCSFESVVELLGQLSKEKFDVIKTENLYTIDGKPMFTSSQDHNF